MEGEGARSGAAEGSLGQQGTPGSKGRPVELPTGPVGCRPVPGHLVHSVLAEPRDTVTCKQPCLCHMHKGSSCVSVGPAGAGTGQRFDGHKYRGRHGTLELAGAWAFKGGDGGVDR